jgi:hypothetical protein
VFFCEESTGGCIDLSVRALSELGLLWFLGWRVLLATYHGYHGCLVFSYSGLLIFFSLLFFSFISFIWCMGRETCSGVYQDLPGFNLPDRPKRRLRGEISMKRDEKRWK